MKHRVVIATLLSGLAACATTPPRVEAAAWSESGRVALMPLRDLTGDPDGVGEVTRALRAALEARGIELVDAGAVDELLRRQRIRRTFTLDAGQAVAVGRGTGAGRILLGTLVEYEPAPTPKLGLALRTIDPLARERGRSSLVALTGESFRGLLGLGAIESAEELVAIAVDEALAELEAPLPANRASSPEAADALPLAVLLPVENRSERSDADVLFGETLAHAWAHGRLALVEPAEMLFAMRELRVRSAETMDRAALAQLADRLGARFFVRASLEAIDDNVIVDGEPVAEVQASVLLIDARTFEVVDASSRARRGDDYRKLLGLGIERQAVALAERVSDELVAELDPTVATLSLDNRNAEQ